MVHPCNASYSVIKRNELLTHAKHQRISNAFYSMKAAGVKRPHATWFYWDDILEKVKLHGERRDRGLQGHGGSGELSSKGHKGTSGVENVLYHDYGSGYTNEHVSILQIVLWQWVMFLYVNDSSIKPIYKARHGKCFGQAMQPHFPFSFVMCLHLIPGSILPSPWTLSVAPSPYKCLPCFNSFKCSRNPKKLHCCDSHLTD